MRIFDCTTYLEPPPPGSEDPYVAVSGHGSFETAHIPGADFLDLQGEFSDNTTRLRFMMPPIEQLETAFGRHGIGSGCPANNTLLEKLCGPSSNGAIRRERPESAPSCRCATRREAASLAP